MTLSAGQLNINNTAALGTGTFTSTFTVQQFLSSPNFYPFGTQLALTVENLLTAIDLTGTYLTRLRLSGGHVRSLRLPRRPR